MNAITYSQFGGPDVLNWSQIAQPIPQGDQLLVAVKACALNRADLLQRRGKYPPPQGESDILGLEIAGEVVAMGETATGFGIGEKVFGLVASGAYAEYCLIDQGLAIPKPVEFSFTEAAAIPEAFLTAQEALFHLGELKPRETVLIHAGGSGVGTAAIQLAKLMDATIFTTLSSHEKFEKVQTLGAQHIFNYKEQNFAEEILKVSDGVDVIIDFVGANYFKDHMRLLKRNGRLVIVGYMSGSKLEMDLSILQKQNLQMKGLAMRTKTIAEKRMITETFKNKYLPQFLKRQLRPVIDSTFAIKDVRLAHDRMESNVNVGKIILEF